MNKSRLSAESMQRIKEEMKSRRAALDAQEQRLTDFLSSYEKIQSVAATFKDSVQALQDVDGKTFKDLEDLFGVSSREIKNIMKLAPVIEDVKESQDFQEENPA